MDKRLVILFLVILILLFLLLAFYTDYKRDDNNLNIYFFDAGKADSALVYTKDLVILIDTGEENLYSDIDTYLNKYGIDTIDYLIITHFDKDHVGSASSIIDNYNIRNVLQSNYPKDSDVYNKYIDSLKKKSIKAKTIKNEYNIDVSKDLKIVVNGPVKDEYEDSASNNSSLITSIYYKKNSFLFMGDAKDERIEEFLADNNEKYDFVKVPYHGRELDNLETLINSINPKYAVITSSNKKIESDATITILKKYNIDYYLTREGSILVNSNGTNITIRQYEKNNH